MDESDRREIAARFLQALADLWSATDYGECHDLSLYSDEELKKILGEWIHVRKQCDSIFRQIRESRPELHGLDGFGRERPVEERLRDAGWPDEDAF